MSTEAKLQSHEGQQVPDVTFHTRTADNQWLDLTTDQIFKNKTVVVFSLPGAFTPTCSTSHLPRYEELYPAFKESGVDDIYCVSVNDSFVMNEWFVHQGAKHVKPLPDGNGDFTKGMGMLVDKSAVGFGPRSWRYSMLVRDGRVEKMFIEPQVAGDPFQVSDADTMIKHINSTVPLPKAITIFSKPGCSHCARAKQMMKQKNLHFEEIVLDQPAVAMRTLRAVAGATSTPQVFVDGKLIGGADQVESWIQSQ